MTYYLWHSRCECLYSSGNQRCNSHCMNNLVFECAPGALSGIVVSRCPKFDKHQLLLKEKNQRHISTMNTWINKKAMLFIFIPNYNNVKFYPYLIELGTVLHWYIALTFTRVAVLIQSVAVFTGTLEPINAAVVSTHVFTWTANTRCCVNWKKGNASTQLRY